MSPKDYIKARQDSLSASQHAASKEEDSKSKKNNSTYYVAWIAGRPYVPELSIGQPDDAKRIAAHLMELNLSQEVDSTSETAAIMIDPDSLKVETISGGRTNTLYLVSGFTTSTTAAASTSTSSKSIPEQVLVRVFGAEGMIDRDTENTAFAALSAASVAPPYFGRFANGRLEGWMDGMRPLDLHELPVAATGIAEQLARLHTQFQTPPELVTEPNLFSDLDNWMDQALQSSITSSSTTTTSDTTTTSIAYSSTTAQQLESLQLKDKVRPELDWLKEQVAQVLSGETTASDSICFCHNDVLASNVLITSKNDADNGGNQKSTNAEKNDATTQIQLIDFEYGGVNYRAFDIANHFNEYAGGPPDLAVPNYQLRPTHEQQRAFVRTYLETAAAKKNEHDGVFEVSEAAVDVMMKEVQIFLLANHLYWGLWAVNQAATEGCEEYDYVVYAVNRIRQYWIDKEEQQMQDC